MGNSIDSMALMQTFVQIAAQGSLSAAARALDTTQASVSRQLKVLESRLGVTLVRRSTHNMILTQEGSALLPRAQKMIDDWTAIQSEIGEVDKEPTGVLRVVAPTGHGPTLLARLAAQFTQKFPAVTIDLVITDGPVDLVALGADLMLRVGPVQGQEVKIRKIGEVERWLVGTPDIVERYTTGRGTPKEGVPIVALAPFYDDEIKLKSNRGQEISVKGTLRVKTTVLWAAHAAIMGGGGIGLLPSWLVNEEVQDGRLKRLCSNASVSALPIYLAFPPGPHRPYRAILFAEEIEKLLAK